MANSYLNHETGGTTTSVKLATFSAWVKRSATGNNCIFGHEESNSLRSAIYFSSDSLLYFQNGNNIFNTNRKFRDFNAWYHIVIQWDLTQSTAADRVKLYVNGVQETSFSATSYPSQNASDEVPNFGQQTIGANRYNNAVDIMYDGYMSHVAFVDGSVVAPTVFGQTDSTSGIWRFKSPSGVTWGTNGFHLKMENSGALGTDSSGQGNNFTVNGNLKQSINTPSNIYNTLNLLDTGYASSTILNTANGGTTTMNTSGFGDYGVRANLAVSKGKWYWEAKITTSNTLCIFPMEIRLVINLSDGSPADDLYGVQRYSDSTTNIYSDGTFTQNSSTMWGGITSSDIISFALDMDNGKLFLAKNGAYKNQSGATGDPVNGTNPTFTISDTTKTYGFYTEMRGNDNNGTIVNFGEGRFGTTAISSAGSNGNGALFEYDVPSGYYALNTKNLNTYG